MTNPANACDIPQASMVGSSACTNQSDTKAVTIPAMTRVVIAREMGQGFSSTSSGVTFSLIGPPFQEKGMLAANTSNNTNALAMLKASSCCPAGVWIAFANVGTTKAETASTIKITI